MGVKLKIEAVVTMILRRRQASPMAIVALCLLSLMIFWRVALLHQALVPIDILFENDPLWSQLTPHSVAPSHNYLEYDIVTQFYPWSVLSATALHQGTLPLWNPYSFAGTPFLAALQPAVLYPINLALSWLVQPIDVLGARAIIQLALTMIGTFLLARRLTLSRAGSLVAALAFGFGLPYFVWIPAALSVAATWLPWLLLAVEGTLTARTRLPWALTIAGVFAMELLSGHGEIAAHVTLLCIAYATFRLIMLWRSGRNPSAIIKLILILGAGFALGAAIAAAQLAPTLEQLSQSSTAFDRENGAHAAPVGILGQSTYWGTLIVGIIPNFFGNPTWHVSLLPLSHNYFEIALYIGTAPLFLALFAIIHSRNANARFFALAAFVALGIALRFPVIGMLNDLPVVRVTNNMRLHVEYAFAMSMMAGYGLDAIGHRDISSRTRRLMLWWGSALAALGVWAVGILSREHVGHAQSLSMIVIASVATPALWFALFAAAVALYIFKKISIDTFRLSAVCLTGVDLLSLTVNFHTTSPRPQALAVPPAVRMVRQDHSLYRVVGLGESLIPDISSNVSLQDIRGYDPAYSAAYERYFAHNFGASGPAPVINSLKPASPAARSLDLLNVAYIFAACGSLSDARAYPLVYRGAGCVYRNRSVMPRAFIVHRASLASPARAMALLGSGIVNPRSVALIDPTTVRNLDAWKIAPASAPSSDAVIVTRYELNQVDLLVHSARRGVLVLSDTYAPGWRARVDGLPVSVARANATFRAVAIGPGIHRISFVYLPNSFVIGGAISIIALAAWLILLTIAMLRARLLRRRHSYEDTGLLEEFAQRTKQRIVA